MKTDLSKYDNSWYIPGSRLQRTLWYIVSVIVFESPLVPLYSLKCRLLRLFGASIGRGVVIKPYVKIKYPWLITIGDNTWIGEKVWIDNLTNVTIGNNCCLSQGAYLCTGNHDWRKASFDLVVRPITLNDGAWIGARSAVAPGVTVNEGAVLSLSSTAINDLEEWTIYQGNPAKPVQKRYI